MSGDDKDRGGELVQFPRVVLPPSFDAPEMGHVHSGEASSGDDAQIPGAWPSLPRVSDMAPPLALMMPGVSKPDSGDASSNEEEVAFTPPEPADPANPTVKDTLAVCMAIVTALGVAAVNGMWHRARHRSALADQARANVDKATQKAAAGRGGPKGTAGSDSSLLRSLGSSGKKTRRSSGKHRPPRDTHSGSPHGPGRDKKRPSDRKAPKADRDGKKTWTDPSKPKRPKKQRGKGGLGSDGACVQTPKPKKPDTKTPKTDASKKAPKPPKTPKDPAKGPDKLRWKAPKRKGSNNGERRWTSGRPKGQGNGGPKRKNPGKLTWRAAKRRPCPGGAQAVTGRKRWAGRSKVKPVVKQRRKSWTRRTRKAGARWFKRWAAGRPGATTPPPWPRTTTWKASWKRGKGSARRRPTSHGRAGSHGASSYTRAGTPPPPPPGFGGMRPPPWADRRVRMTAERVYPDHQRRQDEPEFAALAGAPAGGRLALSAGSTPTSTSAPAHTNGARFVTTSTPMTSTQYADAELTIYDVIEADADMAEEITAGVDEARATADGCEQLMTRLEAVHAKIVELKVPGLLAGWMVRLMDKTATVRARALAIADKLPAASEAISVAGSNAAARHQHLADVTRDMGHVRPAEREYHNE